MDKIKNRALTYSLLAHIRNKGQIVSGPIEIFIPLIKRTLSKLIENKLNSGESILEIKNASNELYGIDFPIPVLRTILEKIAKEINTENEIIFQLYQDDSYQLINYAFTEFEETVNNHLYELENLEKLFHEFCLVCKNNKPKETSILHFIEKNKLSLSKYLAQKPIDSSDDFTFEAQFVEYFKKIPPVYEIIRKIYLGSILASYIEYKTEDIQTNIELLFDTNFILGFLDLNTKESANTCKKIVEITKLQGYRLSVLNDTIQETKSLLKAKSENFDTTFLQKKIYPEDIYNACERRKLNKADIERISDNLENELNLNGFFIIPDTSKYKNIAKHSNEYITLKAIRHSDYAALHDAIAIYYVREKRKKKIKDFENVNCWFITNPINREKYTESEKNDEKNGYQPETIKADDFLNILWLSNPSINKSIDTNEITDIGLTSLVSMCLTSSLPKLSIIRELDDNIHKYGQDNGLTDTDIVRIATRITTKQLTDIEYLNKLAKENKALFVKRLDEEAKKQKEIEDERIKKLDLILKEFSTKSERLESIKSNFEKKSKSLDNKIKEVSKYNTDKEKEIDFLQSELIKEKELRKLEENNRRQEKRFEFELSEVKKWQSKSRKELFVWVSIVILSILFLLWKSEWNIVKAVSLLEEIKKNIVVSFFLFVLSTIFSAISLKKWYDRNHNYSNIENYKKNIKIPDNLKNL